jgi:hypothetical protein
MRVRLLLLAIGAAMPLAAQKVPTKLIVEDFRVDAVAEEFPRIDRVRISARGQIALHSLQDHVFRLYDSTGRKIIHYGRRGAGPGETRLVNAMGWKADTLWAWDNALKRLIFLGLDGKFLRHEVPPPSLNRTIPADSIGAVKGSIVQFGPVMLAPDGRVIAWAETASGRGVTGRLETEQSFMLAASDGTRRKNVGTAVKSDDGVYVRFQIRGDTTRSAMVPFWVHPSMVYAHDGTRFGVATQQVGERTGSYTVRVVRWDGDTLFARTYPFTGKPIPPNVRDSAINAMNVRSYSAADNGVLRDMARKVAPRIYPPVRSMLLGYDNTTWVIMRPDPDGSSEALSLDGKGNPMFTVRLPRGATLVGANPRLLWTLQEDEDGLQSVVRYRIR